MNEVVWSATALVQLRAIRAWLEQFNPRAAERLAERLVAAGNSLKHFPHRGRKVPHTNARELVSVSPYIIRYEVVGHEVHVLRIRHSSRRPTRP